MSVWAAVAITLTSIVLMEVFAWAIHKYVMHGPGWGWHESHHRETDGPFEKNDLYAVWFSVIAAGLFIAGSLWWPPLWFVALGLTIYGLLYA
ncbi:MAG: beta-carotene hydroxylase, partial [Litorimonas sp.]